MATGGSSKSADSPSTRGAAFPYQSLPEAVQLVKDAGSHGRGHSAQALAGYAGHQSHTSGPFRRKVAALKDWGFITGTSDRFTLTESAMVVAHPPSREREREVLLNSFKQSGLFWLVYENSAKDRVIELASVGNAAVGNLGVAVASKDRFVRNLVDSAELIGLAERVGSDKIRFVPLAEAVAVETTEDAAPVAVPRQSDPAGATPADGRSSAGSQLPIVRQAFPVAGGEVSFQISTSEPLPPAAFIQIAKIVEELGKLAGIISPMEAASGNSSD